MSSMTVGDWGFDRDVSSYSVHAQELTWDEVSYLDVLLLGRGGEGSLFR